MGKMKLRQYARHRGVSHVAVMKAIESGRLGKSVSRDEKDRPLIDAELADKEWPKMTKEVFKGNASGKPGDLKKPAVKRPLAEIPADLDGEPMLTFAEARELRENYQARLEKLRYERESGKVVDSDEIQKKWVSVAAIVRTKVLGIPSKARQRLTDMTADQYATLEAVVRETLEDLADGDA